MGMSSELHILAVDDELPALEDLAHMLRGSAQVGQVSCASSGEDALLRLAERHFDAVFLDVRMPGLDGLQLARVLGRFQRPPRVVFVSAHEDAAVPAFEVRALDYLMKPVGSRRMEQAVSRVAEAVRESEPTHGEGSHESMDVDILAVDNPRGGGTHLVHRSDILHLQAHGDYVRVVSDEGRFLLRDRLTDVERRWHRHGFVRVHRGYVANLQRAVEVRPAPNGTAAMVFSDGSKIPVARRHVGELRRRLGVLGR